MKIELVKISEVKNNPSNPRIIKDDKFKKLVKSIKEFPEMLQIRPIVVDENNIVLGGNMRLKACVEAGLKEVYIVRAINLTEEQKKEFIIKDNSSFGEWDWDILANEWDNKKLNDWGLEVWSNNDDDVNLDNFFSEETKNEIEKNKFQIILEYTKEDFEIVKEAFEKLSGTKEKIIFNLLGL